MKKRILITVAWFVIGIVVTAAIAAVVVSNSPHRERNARAAAFGSAGGLVVAIGCGAIWLPWAARVGKKRREERERAKLAAKKDKRRKRQSGR